MIESSTRTTDEKRNDAGALGRAVHDVIRRRWLIAGLGLTGAVIGAVIGTWLPTQWDATTLIQIGQVGQAGTSERPASPIQLETTARVVERVRDPGFVQSALTALDGATPGSAGRISIKASISRGAELIQLHVSADSADSARLAAKAMVAHLVKMHDKLAESMLTPLRSELRAIDAELSSSLQQKLELEALTRLGKGLSAGERFSERVLLGSLIQAQDATVRALRERKLRLEEQLSPTKTYPTAQFSELSVAPNRISRAVLVAVGLAGGLLVGLLWALAPVPGLRIGHPG